MSEAHSQGSCVHVWLCHHAGIIKVIDLLCSIMRAGAATVTFGRKCHSTLNDDSDDRPYFGGHFSNMDTLFSQKPGREVLTQQNGERWWARREERWVGVGSDENGRDRRGDGGGG